MIHDNNLCASYKCVKMIHYNNNLCASYKNRIDLLDCSGTCVCLLTIKPSIICSICEYSDLFFYAMLSRNFQSGVFNACENHYVMHSCRL
jgi:hypothetical protein